MVRESWQAIAQRVQEHRDHSLTEVHPTIPDTPVDLPANVTSIPETLLTAREIQITTLKAEEILNWIEFGELTSTETTCAFLRRAGLAQKLTNCITELLPGRAIERARELDAYFEKNKKLWGPLHGLPISVKEHWGMKGLSLNAGFVAWADNHADEDALTLRILWEAGCVFYARTTEPQTLMHLETSSNLYGVTVNPHNRSLTSGGSSGGEGALVGLHGSCLGIGSDIGGSIRAPAANNGIYGLRPTANRIPVLGCASPAIGFGYIDGSMGPLSTSIKGLKLFMKTVIDARPWLEDPSLMPMPWRGGQFSVEGSKGRVLKVAVLWDDGVVKPHSPIVRALQEVVERLKGVQGVEVVDWKPYKHDFAWELIASLYYIGGFEDTKEIIESSGEPWRPLSKFITSENPHYKPRTFPEIVERKAERDKYRQEYSQLWNSTATSKAENGDLEGLVDVILSPAGPGLAPPLDHSRYWGYTSQWNLVDYPAVVFPVTTADPNVDVQDKEYAPRNEKDGYNHKLYDDPTSYQGMPVSLQLIGRRFEDEKVLEALEYITKKIGLPFT